MSEWNYGDAFLRHPCEEGIIVFENGSMVKAQDLTEGIPPFMSDADLIFVDPPWNQGYISSFYTKAEIGHTVVYNDFMNCLFGRIKGINPRTCYVEIGKEELADVIVRMRKLFRHVTFFNSTYYHKPNNLCYVVRGSVKRHTTSYDGMDEEDIISAVCRDEDYTCVGDLCMGRGLVGVAAYKNGKRFVGTELNHKRLSVLLERISDLGGKYTITGAGK